MDATGVVHLADRGFLALSGGGRQRRIFVLDHVDPAESPRSPSAIARLGVCLRTVEGDS